MPLIGRGVSLRSNVVTNLPSLPVPMYAGSISCSCSFEAFPTGSLEYTGVSEQDISQLERAYEVGSQLSIYDIGFEVASYSYQREGHILKDTIKLGRVDNQIKMMLDDVICS